MARISTQVTCRAWQTDSTGTRFQTSAPTVKVSVFWNVSACGLVLTTGLEERASFLIQGRSVLFDEECSL